MSKIELIDGFWLKSSKMDWVVIEVKRTKKRDGTIGISEEHFYFREPEQCFHYVQDAVVRKKRKWRNIKELAECFREVARELQPVFQRITDKETEG